MRLLPREEKFFIYLQEQVGYIDEAATILLSSMKQGVDALAGAAERIGVLERRGDEVIHRTFTKLNQTFITPIDPEDIHSISSSLDDVLDYIEEAAYRMHAYRLDSITPPMIEIGERIARSAKSLAQAFHALERKNGVLEHCIEINRLEDEADAITRRAVSALFAEERDPIRLIKLKEIYEFLELATDACEDVADELQCVVVKNS
jgi:predicted phosphate transport protein (TIGR00153 family)